MRTVAVLVCMVCLLSIGTAETLSPDPEQRSNKPYLPEGLGGLAGLGCGTLCGVAVTFGVAIVTWGRPDFVGFSVSAVALALPAWTGYRVSRAAGRMDERGSSAGALVGAYAGLPVAIGVGALTNAISGDGAAGAITGWAVALFAVPAGAVLGYNFNTLRGARVPSAPYESRLSLPAVAIECVRSERKVAEFGIRLQLTSLKF